MFYLTPLPYVAKPSEVSCKLLPFMIGLCFVLVVGKSTEHSYAKKVFLNLFHKIGDLVSKETVRLLLGK